MRNDDLWKLFLETGRIDAYMAYKTDRFDFDSASHNKFGLYTDDRFDSVNNSNSDFGTGFDMNNTFQSE